ncbi:hypothetical protein EUX98_g2708 [Antrodiella citrinella]|uniref:Fungal-type protein kinase domain-containing protein n=1 Tax=Antrodiella citrinella TaxID=2447956 RepID=A0A4S4N138_9APHY|nr:hypothetical protein EUX98_g2708 [Antrodiella citrinella]
MASTSAIPHDHNDLSRPASPALPRNPLPSNPIPDFLDAEDVRATQYLYRNHIIRDAPVLEVVNRVWQFDPSMIKNRAHNIPHITIPHLYLNEYGTATSALAASKALRRILSSTRRQLVMAKGRLPYGAFYQRADPEDLCAPSISFSSSSKDTWDTLGAFVHVQKEVEQDYNLVDDIRVAVEPREGAQDGAAEPPRSIRIPFTDDVNDGPAMPRVSPDPRPLNGDEIVPALFVRTMLCHGLRLYATGLAIQESRITLYYGDRFGIVKSQPFDFIEEPELLVLVIGALSNAHTSILGFHPYLRLGITPKLRVSFLESYIKMPRAYDDEGDARGPWVFKIIGDAVAQYNPGVVLGRAATIVQVRVPRNPADPEDTGDKKFYLKTVWNSEKYMPEDDALRMIHVELPKHNVHAAKHVASLYCSMKASVSQMGLARNFFGDVEGNVPRICRSIVTDAYLPMFTLRNAGELKVVFLDVLRAHRCVWEYAGILHRNISTNNVAYFMDNDTPHGILTGFDLCRRREDVEYDCALAQDGLLPESRIECVGTLPFISIELLSEVAIVHKYHHDLESFFYLLCFYCVAHNPAILDYDRPIQSWSQADKAHCVYAKTDFLYARSQDEAMETLFRDAHEEYRELIEAWVRPLLSLFRRTAHKLRWAYGLRPEEELEEEEEEEQVELPDPDFSAFMEAIGENENWV